MTGVTAPPFAKYNADGTGRDTYIRRDPVECYGKNNYKTEPKQVTRMGAAGSHIPRERGKKAGQEDEVGGASGGKGFERPDRFLTPKAEEYPVEVTRFSSMKEIMQDAYVSSQQTPGYLKNISGYAGYKPRCPTQNDGSAEWASVSHVSIAPPPEPME